MHPYLLFPSFISQTPILSECVMLKCVAGAPHAEESIAKEAAWYSLVGTMEAPDCGTDTAKNGFLLFLLHLQMCNLVILWVFITVYATS